MTASVIEFSSDDVGALVAQMDAMSVRGKGWINVGPGLTPEQFAALPERSGLGKWFSGRGPAVPMATWTPSPMDGRSPAQIGIAHGTGPDALKRLAEQAIELPPDWVKRQDHAKNGVVAELPTSAAHESVVEWMMVVMAALSPRVEVGQEWVAEVYGAD